MAANKSRNHVYVLPEDDANRQLAVGFRLETTFSVQRQFQIEDPAGGWTKVRDKFSSEFMTRMHGNECIHIVLLVDFDRRTDRIFEMKRIVPEAIQDRVFVIGVFSEPEDLKNEIAGGLENIGRKLAIDCRENSQDTGNADLLRHNTDELKRMIPILRPILFPEVSVRDA